MIAASPTSTTCTEVGVGRLEALALAEERAPGDLVPAGQVRFGLAGKGLWQALDLIRAGPADRAGFVPVKPMLTATIKHFGRFKSGNAIRDGVLIGMPPLRGGGRG